MKSFQEQVLRREIRSSRAVLSTVVAVVVGLLALLGILEAVLRALGQSDWLIDPLAAARSLISLPSVVSPPLLVLVGVLIVFVAFILIAHAVLPGRRARHGIASDRVAVVVDDAVIASALARRARWQAGVTGEQVIVIVSRLVVQVNIRPTSGIGIDTDSVQMSVEAELKEMGLTPLPRVNVIVSRSGVVGV